MQSAGVLTFQFQVLSKAVWNKEETLTARGQSNVSETTVCVNKTTGSKEVWTPPAVVRSRISMQHTGLWAMRQPIVHTWQALHELESDVCCCMVTRWHVLPVLRRSSQLSRLVRQTAKTLETECSPMVQQVKPLAWPFLSGPGLLKTKVLQGRSLGVPPQWHLHHNQVS